jgi:O-antigen/teichoic acid export membrane protein
MSDRHYLLKVMGLSAIPRLITFGLTLVSFPLMVRAVGASQYGVVVFIGAIAAVVESFADFGVSSAAGKEIAAAREAGRTPLPRVVGVWARLQMSVAVIAFVPLLAVTYVIASASASIPVTISVFALLVTATWMTIPLNFIRAAMSSMLAFRSLTALDACESVLRSASWLIVAYVAPSTMGLAMAGLITTGCAVTLGAMLLWRLARRLEGSSSTLTPSHALASIREMLKESVNFLWLRLATRVFQSIPIVAFGKLFGSELVGIVGAFARIVEMLNFPFAVIGNALAVRAMGVLANGPAAARRLWDVVIRFLSLSVLLAVTGYITAAAVAKLLLPGSQGAPAAFAILSATILTSAISAIIAPMSDYVGALRARNILLSACSVIQLPAIWLGARLGGQTGAIVAYVIVLIVMNFGYVRIALSMFFPSGKYRLRPEMNYFLLATATALAIGLIVHRFGGLDRWPSTLLLGGVVVEAVVLWLGVALALLIHIPAKRFFFDRGFFDFQVQPPDTRL